MSMNGGIAATTEGVLARRKARAWWLDLWVQLFKTKPLAAFGFVIVAFYLIVGIFATWIAPEGVNEPDVTRLVLNESAALGEVSMVGPSWQHPMGLDRHGRDFFSRVIHGGRTSVLIGMGVVAFGIFFGTLVGVFSAWWGGKFDLFAQRVVDAFLAFPALPVAITIVAVFPANVAFMPIAAWAMVKIILTLGILWVPWNSRIIRSAALVVKESEYVGAARAMGATGSWIVRRHVMPNVAAPIVTLATLALGGAILYEAMLSFLGYGVPSPNPTWGGMLQQSQISIFGVAPWLMIFPGIVLAVLVFGINLLGDGLRDLLDPRMRGQ